MKGLIQIYCGQGKGKTSAAAGAAIRAAGQGFSVCFTQFLKDSHSGEIKILGQLPKVKLFHCEKSFGFSWTLSEEEKEEAKAAYQKLFTDACRESVTAAQRDKEELVLLILDEIMAATSYGFVPPEMVTEFLESKPENLEVIMTGRNPREEWISMADYVSEIQPRKHPYARGVAARRGIEW